MSFKKICTRVLISIFLSIQLFQSSAQAYATDTHFYEFYAMLRWAGYNHEVAREFALYNQWIDVQMSTSAMLPVLGMGTQMRRLFHFPTNAVELKITGKSEHGMKLKIFGMATRNHPMASELISQGMRVGNRFLVGGGFHVLMDSFAHSGNPYSIGHAIMGHWPDRPHTFMEKHNMMRETVFKAIVAVRDLLPPNALDENFSSDGLRKNVSLNATELYESYISNEIIQDVVESDPMRDSRYVVPVVGEIIAAAQSEGILRPTFTLAWLDETFPGIFNLGYNVQELTTMIFGEMTNWKKSEQEKYFNLDLLYSKVLPELPVGKTFAGVTITRESFEQAMGEKTDEFIVSEMVRIIVDGFVPREPFRDAKGNYHDDGYTPKAAFENSRLFEQEQQIKFHDWQSALKKIFAGPRVVLKVNDWKAETKKNILKTLASGSSSLEESTEIIDKVSMGATGAAKYFLSMMKYVILDALTYMLTSPLEKWGWIKTAYGNARLVANPSNMLYQFKEVFDQLLENGFYRPLLSSEQVEKMKSKFQKSMAKEAKRLHVLEQNTPAGRVLPPVADYDFDVVEIVPLPLQDAPACSNIYW